MGAAAPFVDDARGRPALVLEDPGGELMLQRAGTPMDVADVLRVGAGVAAALRLLHVRDLIHKDIKPANVMTDWELPPALSTTFDAASRSGKPAAGSTRSRSPNTTHPTGWSFRKSCMDALARSRRSSAPSSAW